MLTIDYWHDNHARRLLQTIMGCVWPWTQKFLTKIILGVNSKRNIIYSRSCSVNLLIASYSIRWSIDADLGSFGSFGLAPQKSVHHYGQRKGLSPVSLRSFASYAFYFLRCRFAWSTQLTQRLCLVPWREVWRNAAKHRLTCWPWFRQFRFGAAGGHLCACDSCMTQVMAAESTCLH